MLPESFRVSIPAVHRSAWKSIIRMRVACRLRTNVKGYVGQVDRSAPIRSVTENVGIILELAAQHGDDDTPHIDQRGVWAPDPGWVQRHVCSMGYRLVECINFAVVFGQGITSIYSRGARRGINKRFRGRCKEDHLEKL